MCIVMLIEENYKYMYKDAQKRNKEILKNVNNKTFRGHWDLAGFFLGGVVLFHQWSYITWKKMNIF